MGIDVSQLYPFSMCQEMPIGLYTRWELDTNSQKFKARTNKCRNFENMVMSYLQSQRPECTIESYYTTGKQKKIDYLAWTVFVLIATQFSNPWVVISIFSHAKNLEQTSRGRKCREESGKENMMN